MSPIRITALILLLCLAGLLIYRKPEPAARQQHRSLAGYLRVMGNWQGTEDRSLDLQIASSLELDDYLFREYSDGVNNVTLYIGYYLYANKVGAAHDPLVCFPGQGWEIEQRNKGSIIVDNAKGISISYSAMVVRRNMNRVLVVYWFQAYDSALSDTFSQKAVAFWNAWKQQPTDSALVRITVELNGRSETEAYGIVERFVEDFYPAWIHYIRQESADTGTHNERASSSTKKYLTAKAK